MAAEKRNWDPDVHERAYCRHVTTGDRGWLVRRDGKDYIKLDRGPGQEHLRNWRACDWAPDVEIRKLTPSHVARVAFSADRELRSMLGHNFRAATVWLDLTDAQKKKWIEGPPGDGGPRDTLYRAVTMAMEGL